MEEDDVWVKEGAERVELSFRSLSVLPASVVQVAGATLVELNVAYNQLKELPPGIAKLRVLQKLKATNNHLSTLPPEVCNKDRYHQIHSQIHSDWRLYSTAGARLVQQQATVLTK